MCGYCIEGGFLIPALESAYVGGIPAENDDFYLWGYLQEEENLYSVIEIAKESDDCHEAMDIIFCRLFENYILYGFDMVIFKKMTSTFGPGVLDSFIEKRIDLNNEGHMSRIREKLCDKKNYQNDQLWKGFISDKAKLIEDSLKLLSFYYDWWIKGHNKKESDPYLRLKKTGIMDPIADTPKNEWERFYAMFPLVYFSLMFLWKYDSDTELIEKIALHCPKGVPDFVGYDLWLQRKAFAFLVQKVGLIKVLEKTDQIRVELIYYALLKCKPPIDEIKIVLELLREIPGRFAHFNEDVDYYISQIEDVIISTLPH